MKVLNVCGARPNFMKIAALVEALRMRQVPQFLVHTGQHYDQKMSKLFFEELGIPTPDLDLGVGSGSHAVQTAEVMKRFEPVLEQERPDVVVVVGDVNSTLACSLVAVKMGIRVAHVEAGLRSFDRGMPEEINRIVTDSISDLLFVSEPSGIANLKNEGVAGEKIHFVGNVMIDTLLRHRDRALGMPTLENMGLKGGRYAVVTLHRPSNVDDPESLRGILSALAELSAELKIVFPLHPRTRARMASCGLDRLLESGGGPIRDMDPLGYLEFLGLVAASAIVITDSGGIQEETTVLGVPCITVRENTERPATVSEGTNQLVGRDPKRMLAVAREVLNGKRPKGKIPELWDGKASQRIAEILVRA